MREWKSYAQAPDQLATLLVITSDDLKPALIPFADHKDRSGVPTLVVSMTMITRDIPGADDAERVKRVIAFATMFLKVKYVMLAGDANMGHVPVRHRFVSAIDISMDCSGTYNPTDHYYADLFVDASAVAFNTWDSSPPDGNYNEQTWGVSPWNRNPDGVTGYPDVVVARVPASTVEQLSLYVQKVIQYETGARPGKERYSVFANRTYSSAVCPMAETIIDGVKSDKEAVISRVGLSFSASDSIESGWSKGGLGDIQAAALTSGWICYLGHGAPTVWADAMSFDDAMKLNNEGNFPVVMSSGCETGQFVPNLPWIDAYPIRYADMKGVFHEFVKPKSSTAAVVDRVDMKAYPQPLLVPQPSPYDVQSPPQGRCMASAWLFARSSAGKPSGGIAYMGETIGLQPTLANEFQAAVMASYNQDRAKTLGDAWRAAQIKHFERYKNGPQTADMNFSHPRVYLSAMTLFGDPSLRLRPTGRILWRTAEQRISLWSIDAAANQISYREHGPLAGWTAVNYAEGRLLWRNADGRVSLWRVDDQGAQTSYVEHGPFPGFNVVNYDDGMMLWRHNDGRISLWRMDQQGQRVASRDHGPHPGWTALGCAKGRVIWRHNDGRISIWTVDDECRQVAFSECGPHPGWTLLNYADDRILWRNTDGRISLWKVNELGQQVTYQEHGPHAGWTALGYSGDRVLWRHDDGRISLWQMDDQCRKVSAREHGPFNGWTVSGYGDE